jgi:hypothetical protein
MCFSERFLG